MTEYLVGHFSINLSILPPGVLSGSFGVGPHSAFSVRSSMPTAFHSKISIISTTPSMWGLPAGSISVKSNIKLPSKFAGSFGVSVSSRFAVKSNIKLPRALGGSFRVSVSSRFAVRSSMPTAYRSKFAIIGSAPSMGSLPTGIFAVKSNILLPSKFAGSFGVIIPSRYDIDSTITMRRISVSSMDWVVGSFRVKSNFVSLGRPKLSLLSTTPSMWSLPTGSIEMVPQLNPKSRLAFVDGVLVYAHFDLPFLPQLPGYGVLDEWWAGEYRPPAEGEYDPREDDLVDGVYDEEEKSYYVTPEQFSTLKAERLALQKQFDFISKHGVIPPFTVQAWCCDFTEGLTGTVPILDIATDTHEGINIPPGHPDIADQYQYSIKEFGENTPFASLSTAKALRNFLAYPAIQKWAPTYRYGVITEIDYEQDTCTVGVDYTDSKIQALNINQSGFLYNVPIRYMHCHAGAFREGDEVVVRFTNFKWNEPKVIGFKKNPKPCGWEEPWDGPGITWKYPWVYSYGFSNGSGQPALRAINAGVMMMTFPATDYGSGALGQFHYLQYIPSNFIVTGSVSNVKFDCAAMIDCYAGSGSWSEYGLLVTGLATDRKTIVQATLKVVYNYIYPHIGCTGFNYEETEWSEPRTGNKEIWWYPGGPHSYRAYHKLIRNNRDVYFPLPERMSQVLSVGIEMQVTASGGWTINMPKEIIGGTLYCNYIGLI